jgi:3,4-dihydroxy 2-butanone 4-phosphate synthase/GTP cyclohydrolase II
MPSEADQLTQEISAASGKSPEMDLRNYGIGAQILADLGIHDMVLLTNSHRHVVGIEGYGINIVGERPIPEA